MLNWCNFQIIDLRRKTNFGPDSFEIGGESYNYNVEDDGSVYHDKLRQLYFEKVHAQHELNLSKEKFEEVNDKYVKANIELGILKVNLVSAKWHINMVENAIPMLTKGMFTTHELLWILCKAEY